MSIGFIRDTLKGYGSCTQRAYEHDGIERTMRHLGGLMQYGRMCTIVPSLWPYEALENERDFI